MRAFSAHGRNREEGTVFSDIVMLQYISQG